MLFWKAKGNLRPERGLPFLLREQGLIAINLLLTISAKRTWPKAFVYSSSPIGGCCYPFIGPIGVNSTFSALDHLSNTPSLRQINSPPGVLFASKNNTAAELLTTWCPKRLNFSESKSVSFPKLLLHFSELAFHCHSASNVK